MGKMGFRVSIITLLAGALMILAFSSVRAEFGTGWTVQYFNNTDLSGSPVLTTLAPNGINFNFGTGSPDFSVNSDDFSARFQSVQNFSGGTYEFSVAADDGVRVYVDGALLLDRFTPRPLTTDRFQVTLTPGTHQIIVEYFEAVDQAIIQLQYDQVPPPAEGTLTPTPIITPPVTGEGGFGTGWTVQYFNNTDLSGSPVLTTLAPNGINFNFGTGSPDPVVNVDSFSARFQSIQNLLGGTYEFIVAADDGVRVYVDGALLLDRFTPRPLTTDLFQVALTPGTHQIIVEYFEAVDQAIIQLQYFRLLSIPDAPSAEDVNFDAEGSVRTGIPETLNDTVNIRQLYENGAAVQGNDPASAGSIGDPGVIDLGVQQAVDIFSPNGLTYFNGGAVFCLRGEGTLIWLAASGAPRQPQTIGSYTVDEFPGFTCATLFEPGTLVLVRDDPIS